MYKTPLTATVFKDFSACYQHFTSSKSLASSQPYVYVDSDGVKLLTNVVDQIGADDSSVFAISVAQDGFIEMLALHEAG